MVSKMTKCDGSFTCGGTTQFIFMSPLRASNFSKVERQSKQKSTQKVMNTVEESKKDDNDDTFSEFLSARKILRTIRLWAVSHLHVMLNLS